MGLAGALIPQACTACQGWQTPRHSNDPIPSGLEALEFFGVAWNGVACGRSRNSERNGCCSQNARFRVNQFRFELAFVARGGASIAVRLATRLESTVHAGSSTNSEPVGNPFRTCFRSTRNKVRFP